MNMRTWVGILVSLYEGEWSSGIEGRDGGVDVQASEGCTVEVVAVVEIARGWHSHLRGGRKMVRFKDTRGGATTLDTRWSGKSNASSTLRPSA